MKRSKSASRKRSAPARRSRQAAREAARDAATEAAPAAGPLVLPVDCLIADAEPLRQALIDLAKQKKPATLDASVNQRIDTACLQLLAAFVRERRNAKRELVWSGVGAGLLERARLLDLHTALELPADGAASAAAPGVQR